MLSFWKSPFVARDADRPPLLPIRGQGSLLRPSTAKVGRPAGRQIQESQSASVFPVPARPRTVELAWSSPTAWPTRLGSGSRRQPGLCQPTGKPCPVLLFQKGPAPQVANAKIGAGLHEAVDFPLRFGNSSGLSATGNQQQQTSRNFAMDVIGTPGPFDRGCVVLAKKIPDRQIVHEPVVCREPGICVQRALALAQ